MREQLARNIAFLGEEGIQRLRNSFVVIVGVGGVGSHCLNMLARSGIGRIRIVDFDQVSLSSLNRHALSVRRDVGKSKVHVCQQRLAESAPFCHVEVMPVMFSSETAEQILAGNPDFVIDCIDNVPTKVELIRLCVSKNIKVIVSMGSGAKCNPARITVSDISETATDPLSRVTRVQLRKHGIHQGVPCVYSTEVPPMKLLPLEDQNVALEDVEEYRQFKDFRVRILPVIGPIPAMFGNALAAYVIMALADPTRPDPAAAAQPVATRNKFYDKLRMGIINRETHVHNPNNRNNETTNGNLQLHVTSRLSLDDIQYITDEVFRGRCARTNAAVGGLKLVRWDVTKPPTLDNLVLLCTSALHHHDNTIKSLDDYDVEFRSAVEAKLAVVRSEYLSRKS